MNITRQTYMRNKRSIDQNDICTMILFYIIFLMWNFLRTLPNLSIETCLISKTNWFFKLKIEWIWRTFQYQCQEKWLYEIKNTFIILLFYRIIKLFSYQGSFQRAKHQSLYKHEYVLVQLIQKRSEILCLKEKKIFQDKASIRNRLKISNLNLYQVDTFIDNK